MSFQTSDSSSGTCPSITLCEVVLLNRSNPGRIKNSPFSFPCSRTADRDLPTEKLQFCAPNQVVFNSRMLAMGVELVGGDQSLLPAGRTAVSAFVHQIGRQTFRYTETITLSLNTAALFVPLQDAPLVDGARLQMRSFCSLTSNPNSFIEKPLSCPSPFSSYLLKLGRASDPNLDKYLATVTHVLVHMQISSISGLCLARNRARVGRILSDKQSNQI